MTFVMIIFSIPLNEASGKLDIKALPKWSEKEGAQLIEDDCLSATEKRVAKIWCKVLRLFTVDSEESFFDLGGFVDQISVFQKRVESHQKRNEV